MSTPVREPLDAFTPLREAVNRFFDDRVVSPDWLLTLGHTFPVDVIETPDDYIIEASLTGVKPENVQITTTGNTLTIRVGRKPHLRHEDEGNYLRRERTERHGPEMSRTLTLPARINPEKVAADYQNGVLVVTVGKDEESKPRTIPLHITKDKVER
jgi:HSP20 family protein